MALMKRIFSVVLICLFLAGCATVQTINPAEYEFSLSSSKDYNKIWNVLIKTLNEQGEMITLAQKDNGIIITDYNSKNPAVSYFYPYQTRYRLNISVYKEHPVRIKIVPAIEGANDYGWQDIKDDGTVLSRIKQALTKRL